MELSRSLAIKFGMSSRLAMLLRKCAPRFLAIILCLVFMIFTIPSPRVKAIAGVDDAALILLASLAAFGIAVTAEQGIDAVGPWITDQFEQYVDSVGDSLSTVWDKIRSGVTKAGQLVLNGFALRYNAGFGEWLISRFSLSDNSSVDTSMPYSSITLSGNSYPIAPGDLFFLANGNNKPFNTVRNNITPFIIPYGTYTFGDGGTISFSSTRISIRYPGMTGLDASLSLTSPSYCAATRLNGAYTFVGVSSSSASPYINYMNTSYFDDPSDIGYYIFNDVQEPTVSPILSTGTLNVPDSEDYDDDDGILIDGLGSWGDSLDDVLDHVGDLTDPNSSVVTDGDITYVISPESVLVDDLVDVGQLTTENSPGFYNGLPLIGGIPDIQFGNLWHYVTDWVGSMSGGLALIGGIMFSLPFVAAFYALVVILLVLSLWRLLRSA